MKYIDPSESVFLPVIISVSADTAHVLTSMANEMDTSLDELLSAIAEDSAIEFSDDGAFSHDIAIPDSISTEDLLTFL